MSGYGVVCRSYRRIVNLSSVVIPHCIADQRFPSAESDRSSEKHTLGLGSYEESDFRLFFNLGIPGHRDASAGWYRLTACSGQSPYASPLRFPNERNITYQQRANSTQDS